jgi:hypothetical protein
LCAGAFEAVPTHHPLQVVLIYYGVVLLPSATESTRFATKRATGDEAAAGAPAGTASNLTTAGP